MNDETAMLKNAEHSTPLAVDLPQAAKMLGVCTATMRREIDRGKLRAFKIGRVYRVRVAELHAYLKRLEGNCTGEKPA